MWTRATYDPTGNFLETGKFFSAETFLLYSTLQNCRLARWNPTPSTVTRVTTGKGLGEMTPTNARCAHWPGQLAGCFGEHS
jgi:hypothetical protein